MGKQILQLKFHLRKPYNEAELLIKAFNEIIDEGGRAEICIINDNPTKNRNILMLKVYRCRNTYYSTSLAASITDEISDTMKKNISKFNFANAVNCPTVFKIETSEDSQHGQTIILSVFELNNPELNKVLKSNFKTFDLA